MSFLPEDGVVGDLFPFFPVPVIACEFSVVVGHSLPQSALVCKFDVTDKKNK